MRKSPVRDGLTVDSGDVDGKLAGAARVVKATYLYPYQMHGSIGSACAVADVQGEKVTVWSASQAVHPLRNTTAMMLGIPPAGVRIVFTMGPGCYGVNGADTVSYDAALMSQAVGKPVRVQLARQDEMAWENYGLAYVVDQRVALDADGTIVAWDYEGWSPTRGGRPGGNAPGNVVTGFLAGFRATAVHAAYAGSPTAGRIRQRLQHGAVVRHGVRGSGVRRLWCREERARAQSHRGVAVLHRSSPVAGASAEHVCARVFHGRDRRAAQGGPGRVSSAAPARSASQTGCHDRCKDCRVGGASFTARGCAADRRGGGPRHRLRALRGRQRLLRQRHRVGGQPGHRRHRREALRGGDGLGSHLEPRRHPEPG